MEGMRVAWRPRRVKLDCDFCSRAPCRAKRRGGLPAQILLYESRAQMNVHLDERAIPDSFEAVTLAGLDDENVPSATFKRLSVHGPHSAAFPDKLDLIVGMPMRPRTFARQSAEQKHGDAHVPPLGPNKFV